MTTESDEPIDCEDQSLIVCPHCGYRDDDSWEIGHSVSAGDTDKTQCGQCGKPFNVEYHVTVTYSTRKLQP